jgi:pseudaminic acid synthase
MKIMKQEFINIQMPKGKKIIGPGQPVFIVAEMSGNHNQDIRRAYKIIDAAAAAGVDAVKLQTYTPDTMTIDCDKKCFQVQVNRAWKGRTLYQLYGWAHTPWEWQSKLKDYGEKKGVLVFSTPFDETAVDFLEEMKVKLYKVASFEVGDLELLKKIGQTKKPVILSRGMASFEEIKTAVKTLKQAGAPQIAILHCVSSYPALPEQMNIATIPDIAKKFKVISGLSDHTLGLAVSLASVGLGACIIEKHFTLKRADGGPDAAFSLEPQEMKQLVAGVREAEKAIGRPTYKIGQRESENMVFRRSLFAVADIKKGEKLTRKNIRCIRPGYGLAPKYLDKVKGKTAVCDIERGTPLSWKLTGR